MISDEMRERMCARRWRGPDGLVHETVAVWQIGEDEFARKPVCFAVDAVRDQCGVALRRRRIEHVDIPDDPAPVNCFGCLGGL